MSPSRKRSELFSLRFAPDELEVLRKAAAGRNQTVAQFLREAALRVATGPRCAHCGNQDDLAWVVITGESRPTLQFSRGPVVISGPYRWAGWRCRACCMRDYGGFALGRRSA